jgi:hypothetical protein
MRQPPAQVEYLLGVVRRAHRHGVAHDIFFRRRKIDVFDIVRRIPLNCRWVVLQLLNVRIQRMRLATRFCRICLPQFGWMSRETLNAASILDSPTPVHTEWRGNNFQEFCTLLDEQCRRSAPGHSALLRRFGQMSNSCTIPPSPGSVCASCCVSVPYTSLSQWWFISTPQCGQSILLLFASRNPSSPRSIQRYLLTPMTQRLRHPHEFL